MQQSTDTLLLVRPHSFRKNEQTAINNYFQKDLLRFTAEQIDLMAKAEFDQYVALLNQRHINTIVVQDNGEWDTPDSVFPNNGISFHQGTVVQYPMFAPNRRLERKLPFLSAVQAQGYKVKRLLDYSPYAEKGLFLEGTGAVVLDQLLGLAYCALSPRADLQMLHRFCADFQYEPRVFTAYQTVDGNRKQIYHTNVMLAIGTHFALVCLDAVDDPQERSDLFASLQQNNRTVIVISEAQLAEFAGNILEVRSTDGLPYILMSSQAYASFGETQREILGKFGAIIHSPLPIIEACGGGGARCMVAEVF